MPAQLTTALAARGKVVSLSLFRLARAIETNDRAKLQSYLQSTKLNPRLSRLAQDHNMHWLHTCPRLRISGRIPLGSPCIWCGASEPTPPGAA